MSYNEMSELKTQPLEHYKSKKVLSGSLLCMGSVKAILHLTDIKFELGKIQTHISQLNQMTN